MRRTRATELRAQLRREEGMTLVEMLVGISAGVVVTFAAYMAMSAALTVQTRTTYRIDAAARGRNAMETITRDIRAQMCLPKQAGYTSSSDPAVLWATGDAIQFYSSVAPKSGTSTQAGTNQPPEMRRIEWVKKTNAASGTTLNSTDAAAQPVGDIIETVWQVDTGQTKPPYTFNGTYKANKPSRRVVIASDIEHARTADGVDIPLFRYYGYTVVGGIGRPSSTPYPMVSSPVDDYNKAGVPSVAAGSRTAIVMVDIQFNSRPYAQGITDGGRKGTDARQTPVVPFFNRVSVRTADPTDPGVSPLCL